MNRSGFAYIVATLILGLLAFMGLFLMQSSTTEYSQAAMSCYTTMAQQLAEAAADEAFFLIEKEFKDGSKNGKKGPLLAQAATGDFQPGSTALNPKLLDILPNYSKYVAVSNELISSGHLTRAGFAIDSVSLSLNDFRPIDYGVYGKPESIYRPKDRPDPFDKDDKGDFSRKSRDYYLSATLSVVTSFRQGSKNHKYSLLVTRDMKIVNVSPIGRAYTLFSCLGADARVPSEVENDLSRGGGRLVLWNHPFQSRVYVHGPAVIGVENPDILKPFNAENRGGLTDTAKGKPGFTQAFQYPDTFAGLSYLPYPHRAFWEGPDLTWWNNENNHKKDLLTAGEQEVYKNPTYVKGSLPRSDAKWSDFENWMKLGDKFVRGTARKQVFLPAGPFCRFPWKFVPEQVRKNWNIKPETWPFPNENLTIEHRYLLENDDFSKNTKIFGRMYLYKLWSAVPPWTRSKVMDEFPHFSPEFALSYGNPVDPSSIWSAAWSGLKSAFSQAWSNIIMIPKITWNIGELLVKSIIKFPDPKSPQATNDQDTRNFFPTNFKIFPKAVVLKLEDTSKIPKDGNGVWVLDGVYWLKKFQTVGDVVYKGKGLIFVDHFNPSTPFTIGGSIIAERDPVSKTRLDHHLTLVYYPFKGNGIPAPDDPCQIEIKGKGNVIEASVFSLAGIKTGPENGVLTDQDYLDAKIDPMEPTGKWQTNENDLANLRKKITSINGNYVNYFMKKHCLNGDIWVFHDIKNPFYFDPKKQLIKEVYNDEDQIMAHTISLSPKIQHMAFSGASQ